MKILGRSPLYTLKATVDEIQVELNFMSHLVVIADDSATGKTWLFKKLSRRSDAAVKVGDRNGISLKYFDEQSEPEEILACTRRVVVVDEAHLIDDGGLIRTIAMKVSGLRDKSDQIYVLSSRSAKQCGVVVGAVELKLEDNVFRFEFPLVAPEDIEYD